MLENTSAKRKRGRPRLEDNPGYFRTDGANSEADIRKAAAAKFDNQIVVEDVSDQRMEKVARGYFVGNKAIGRRKDIRAVLENKVVGRIGKQGKLLSDKLFELIEGVYMVDKINQVQGKEEIKYYKTPPNLNAIIYAIDRVLGKPKQFSTQVNFSLSQLLSPAGTKQEPHEPTAREVVEGRVTDVLIED